MESISAEDPRIIFGIDLADIIIDEVAREVEELRANWLPAFSVIPK